jgi:hypothetical protein
MTHLDWRQLTNQELEMAKSARRSGNEGRARVCARRAAGHVVGEYIARNHINFESESALERLKYLQSTPEINSNQRETVSHFLVHTTPEHQLPIDADLIADVEQLARQLLGEALN